MSVRLRQTRVPADASFLRLLSQQALFCETVGLRVGVGSRPPLKRRKRTGLIEPRSLLAFNHAPYQKRAWTWFTIKKLGWPPSSNVSGEAPGYGVPPIFLTGVEADPTQ